MCNGDDWRKELDSVGQRLKDNQAEKCKLLDKIASLERDITRLASDNVSLRRMLGQIQNPGF